MNIEQSLLTIPLPRELHKQVKARAAMDGTSMAHVVRSLLRQWLEGRVGIEDSPKEPSS